MRDAFRFGRVTNDKCNEADDTLPDPNAGCFGPKGVKEVFVDNIYAAYDTKAAWVLTAAAMGVHTTGATSEDISGMNGMWGTPGEQSKWGNSFFRNMVRKGWAPKNIDLPNGKTRLIFERVGLSMPSEVDQQGFKQFMFKSDMCLLYNFDTDVADRSQPRDSDGRRPRVEVSELLKNDHGCCVWMRPRAAITEDWFNKNNVNGELKFDFCGEETVCVRDTDPDAEHFLKCEPGFPLEECCSNMNDAADPGFDFDGDTPAPVPNDCNRLDADHSFLDGNTEDRPTLGGPAETHVIRFSENKDYWLTWFSKAWNIANSNNQNVKKLAPGTGEPT